MEETGNYTLSRYLSTPEKSEAGVRYRATSNVYQQIADEIVNYHNMHAERAEKIAQALTFADQQGGAIAAQQGSVHIPRELVGIIQQYVAAQPATAMQRSHSAHAVSY